MPTSWTDLVVVPGTSRLSLSDDLQVAVPSFFLFLLLSRIKSIMYAALPRTHPPPNLFALPCRTHLLPPTVPRRCALAHTNQVPYHNCGTLTGVTAITQTFLPILPFRLVQKEKERPCHRTASNPPTNQAESIRQLQ